MSANYSPEARTARMTAIRDLCADGTLEILDGATVLVAHGLSATGGTVADGVWTVMLDTASVAATASGTAAAARIRSAGGAVMVSGLTVATSGADVNLDNTSINAGQQVQYNGALTIAHGEG